MVSFGSNWIRRHLKSDHLVFVMGSMEFTASCEILPPIDIDTDTDLVWVWGWMLRLVHATPLRVSKPAEIGN